MAINAILTMPTGNITFVDWFTQLAQDLPTFDVPRVDSEDQWVEAAERLLLNEECVKLNCPWPATFSDWREWAQRWIGALGGQV